jgi:uncharacterized protein (DUF927 family)
MANFDLLDAVLPTEGRYCVIGVGKYADQTFWDTREEVDAQVAKLVASKFDAYFGCAKFGALNNRTHANAKHFRALWIDIDCGPTKGVPNEKGIIQGYLTQDDGMVEFKRFCKEVGLPRPIMINSGYGIHAYWLLEETIDRREWEPLSNRLRDLCVQHNLIVDSSVFEASRVLRIPGTKNFKYDTEADVTVINDESQRITYQQMKDLLGAPDPAPEQPDFLPRTLSPMMEAMLANKVKRFKTIMIKSAKEEGCQQLLYCYENQESISYDMWRSSLSITAFCVDGDMASHRMSEKYPDYDRAEVDKKVDDLRRTGGPHHCATFEKWNPGGCDGCIHKGKITSPIVLGIEVLEADDDDNEVVVEEDGEDQTYKIPPYPQPFFRGKNGGIYRKPIADEEEPLLVYEHDLYIVKRMTDPNAGETLLFRLHLPRDGVREFSIPLAQAVVKEKLRDALAPQGVAPSGKQVDALLYYTMTFVKNLQYANKAEIMRTQFGWVDGDSKFILGDREITKDGVFYSPPSTATKADAELIFPKGDFEKWKEVFNMYALPGMEAHAFAALTAFGSPLLKFTGLSGAIINVIHQRSGSGKSTTLYMCNSVYGEPQKLASIWKDTANAKMHRLGVMNNLPNTIDEITNTTPMEFSDLSYSISQGRGKNRVKSQSNEMRVNNTSWQGITLSSANASFYEKLGAAKNSPDGESMRLLEYSIAPNDVIDVALGKQMFDHQLRENFGHAGEVYAQWLVNNLEQAKDLIAKVQARIDKKVQFTSRERFWSAVAACNIAGGLIARSIGLHDYDMVAVYDWLVKMLGEMREDIKPPQSNPTLVLGEFINSHMNNALVVNGEIDSRSNLEAMPLLEPRGELLVRYEPDTKHLYIAAKQFKDFCVEQQINYKNVLKELETTNVFVEAMNKRMAKGMKVVSPAVRVLKFDASTSEFIQMDAMLPNDNRDSSLPN